MTFETRSMIAVHMNTTHVVRRLLSRTDVATAVIQSKHALTAAVALPLRSQTL
jgi:hypothetical protein